VTQNGDHGACVQPTTFQCLAVRDMGADLGLRATGFVTSLRGVTNRSHR